MIDILGHGLDEGTQTVVFVHNQRHINGGGVGHQRVPPGFVLDVYKRQG